jgi:hypothetical protein
MGYDFMFEKAKDLSKVRFPCDYGDFEMEEGTFPWEILKQHILSKGAIEQDFSSLGLDTVNYRWEVEGKGAIYVRGTDSYASLDMHADWDVLLDLFIWLRLRDPKVVLADTNIGNYHDPVSFRRFMDENQNA